MEASPIERTPSLQHQVFYADPRSAAAMSINSWGCGPLNESPHPPCYSPRPAPKCTEEHNYREHMPSLAHNRDSTQKDLRRDFLAARTRPDHTSAATTSASQTPCAAGTGATAEAPSAPPATHAMMMAASHHNMQLRSGNLALGGSAAAQRRVDNK